MNELQVIEQNAIVAAFAKHGGTDELFDRIASEVRSYVPDVTTKKGRDAIGSLAMKISKSKTLIEKHGKELVADQKAKIKLIDDDRISVTKKFDALRAEILEPRDAWEQAEKDRVAKHKISIENILSIASLANREDTTWKVSTIREQITSLEAKVIDSSFEEFEQEAKLAKYETLEKLRTALADREKHEAEQAELERVRKEEAERLQRERDERIAREAVEKAKQEADQKAKAESERAEREKAESIQREALLKAQKEAAEAREVELKRQAEERQKLAEIDKKKAIKAERIRIEREAQQQLEIEQKAEAERIANIEYIRSVNQRIVFEMAKHGLSSEQAQNLIKAIHKNEIPNISIKY